MNVNAVYENKNDNAQNQFQKRKGLNAEGTETEFS